MTTSKAEEFQAWCWKVFWLGFAENSDLTQEFVERLKTVLAETREEGRREAEEQVCCFEHRWMGDSPYCAQCGSHEQKWSKT